MAATTRSTPDSKAGPCTLPPGCEHWRDVIVENLKSALRYMEGEQGLEPDRAWGSVISMHERASIAIGKIEQVRREQEILNDS